MGGRTRSAARRCKQCEEMVYRMRYRFIVLILSASLLSGGCKQGQSEKDPQTTTVAKSQAGEKPLLLDDEPPLLLEDEPLLLLDDEPETGAGKGPMADNSRCFVCHINYTQEKIAVVHARQNMGCAHCHGESDEHIADESWASGGNGTAPDKIYTKDQVNPFCLGCHTGDKLPAEPHKGVLRGTSKEKYCTDCHGEHLLKERKTKWK